jgi:hypothetical protein
VGREFLSEQTSSTFFFQLQKEIPSMADLDEASEANIAEVSWPRKKFDHFFGDRFHESVSPENFSDKILDSRIINKIE